MKNKSFRLHYKLLLHFPDGTRKCISTGKKMKVIQALTNAVWEKAYIKVTYGLEKDIYNDGWYENQKDLLKAIRMFTEQPLIEYLIQQ